LPPKSPRLKQSRQIHGKQQHVQDEHGVEVIGQAIRSKKQIACEREQAKVEHRAHAKRCKNSRSCGITQEIGPGHWVLRLKEQ